MVLPAFTCIAGIKKVTDMLNYPQISLLAGARFKTCDINKSWTMPVQWQVLLKAWDQLGEGKPIFYLGNIQELKMAATIVPRNTDCTLLSSFFSPFLISTKCYICCYIACYEQQALFQPVSSYKPNHAQLDSLITRQVHHIALVIQLDYPFTCRLRVWPLFHVHLSNPHCPLSILKL